MTDPRMTPTVTVEQEIDAEVDRIMAMSDDEIMREADADDAAWARGFKLGLASGKSAALASAPAGEGVPDGAGERIKAYIAELLNALAPFARAAEKADVENAERDHYGAAQVFPWQYVNPTHFADAYGLFSERLDPDDWAVLARPRAAVGEPLPADVAELVNRIGRAEWGATDALDADEHGKHVADSVRITAANFDQTEPQQMQGLYVEGTETVICHVGTSPNSPAVARALAGAWNHLCDLAALQSPPAKVEG